MTYQEQIEKIIETHNLAPEANIADFVDNLVREVEYYKERAEYADMALRRLTKAIADEELIKKEG